MYDKKLITQAFEKYCASGRKKAFSDMIESCDGLIRKIAGRYKAFSPWVDDLVQEVKLAMFVGLKNHKQLRKELRSPTTFLYFRVHFYLHTAVLRCARAYQIPMVPTKIEQVIVKMHDEGEDFPDIAFVTNVKESEARKIYDRGRDKLARVSLVPIEEASAMIEHCENSFIDPAKQYEMKETLEQFDRDLAELARQRYKDHPWAVDIFSQKVSMQSAIDIAHE